MKVETAPVRPFLRGLLVGIIVGASAAGYCGLRAALHAQRDTVAACATISADALASLRMGDTTTAERHLEQQIDFGVRFAKMQSVDSPVGLFIAGPLNASQSHNLSMIKYYRHAFPSTRPGHEITEKFLATFPDAHIMPDPTCDSGFCRIAEHKAAEK